MSSVLLLTGALLCGAAILRLAGVIAAANSALALMAITAPLEVYRTESIFGNVSLFRLSVACAALVALHEPRALLQATRSPIVRAASLLVAVMLGSTLIGSSARIPAVAASGQAVVGLVALVVMVALQERVSRDAVLGYIAVGASLTLLLAGLESIVDGLGGVFRLPFLDRLPVPSGLEVTRSDSSRLASGELRLRAAFGDPNHLAGYLVLSGAVVTALLMRNGPKLRRVAWVVWLVGLGLVLLATLSRSGWLGAGVALMIGCGTLLLRHQRSGRPLPRLRTLAIATSVLVVVAAVAAGPVASRLNPSGVTNSVSTGEHERTARVAYEQFRASPLFGIGVGDLGRELKQDRRTSGAHSSFLTVGAEQGLVGLAALIALFVVAAASLFRHARVEPHFTMIAAGYCGFVTANIFYDLYLDDFHWLALGLAAALPRSSTSL